jgi:hypothetical protein
LYAIPIHLSWNAEKGKKKSGFPNLYDHMTTPQLWQVSINDMMVQKKDANGVAILTGPSGLFAIDVDVSCKNGKQVGTELWDKLVEKHGEPQTIKARSGSGGFHYLFRASTPGLKCIRNFESIRVDDVSFGIDGRGLGGVLFAYPSSYVRDDGLIASYEWLNGPATFDACQHMPLWLVEIVNNHAVKCGTASKDGARGRQRVELESVGSPLPARQPTFESYARSMAVQEVQKLLQERTIEDGNASFGGTRVLPEGNRAFQFRVDGPRTCYLEREHNGSNNFTVIQGCAGDLRNVYYNCFGTACQHDNLKLLGELSMSAALEQASVDEFGNQDQRVTYESNLEARLPKAFMKSMVCRSDYGAALIFTRLFQHDRRIVYDVGCFWIWDGKSWIACNMEAILIKSAFMCHMGKVKVFWTTRNVDES